MHRAYGGYLMLDAYKVLTQPYAWDGLKRALQSSQIRIEPLGQALGLMSTTSLEPQSIPLQVKVILVGDRRFTTSLPYDPEFRGLFKVMDDFDDQMERNPENHLLYARIIATIVRLEKLLPLDLVRWHEPSNRVRGWPEMRSGYPISAWLLVDLLRESDYWAKQASRPYRGHCLRCAEGNRCSALSRKSRAGTCDGRNSARNASHHHQRSEGRSGERTLRGSIRTLRLRSAQSHHGARTTGQGRSHRHRERSPVGRANPLQGSADSLQLSRRTLFG